MYSSSVRRIIIGMMKRQFKGIHHLTVFFVYGIQYVEITIIQENIKRKNNT